MQMHATRVLKPAVNSPAPVNPFFADVRIFADDSECRVASAGAGPTQNCGFETLSDPLIIFDKQHHVVGGC
jgi:hypothetical protein